MGRLRLTLSEINGWLDRLAKASGAKPKGGGVVSAVVAPVSSKVATKVVRLISFLILGHGLVRERERVFFFIKIKNITPSEEDCSSHALLYLLG